MNCPCLIAIIKTLQIRYDKMESRIGPPRVARLAKHMANGCWPIEEILRAWAISIAMEGTPDADTLVAVHILLALFVAEARTLQTDAYGVIQEFWHNWTDRCIARLMKGMELEELVFRGSSECTSPKWGYSSSTVPDAQKRPY
jgi:hypothetical protein